MHRGQRTWGPSPQAPSDPGCKRLICLYNSWASGLHCAMSVVPPTSSSAAIPVAGKQPVPGLPRSVASDARYRVIGEIGRGGMGVVYEAVYCETGERVAIKTLASRREGLLRFKNEYRLASRLAHPNLVSLYDLVIADDCSYFVMELAQGVDL